MAGTGLNTGAARRLRFVPGGVLRARRDGIWQQILQPRGWLVRLRSVAFWSWKRTKGLLFRWAKHSTLWACHRMFSPHPNLADEVNRGIIQSEIEGGVFLDDLPPSTVLQIQTMHHCYTAVLLGGSEALLSGHPEFCPKPVQVAISGSTWGGSMLKLQFVGRGMHLEFRHPEYPMPIVTSPIQEIRDNVQLPPIELDSRARGARS